MEKGGDCFMTDREYIEKNMYFTQTASGHWNVHFKFADGYMCSIQDRGSAKVVKPLLKRMIIESVLRQKNHPIQKVVK